MSRRKEKKETETMSNVRNRLREIFLGILIAYTAAGTVLMCSFDKVIPMPFAEYAAFANSYLRNGIMINGFLALAFIAAAMFLCGLMISEYMRGKFYLKVPLCTIAAFDIVIHAYVFLKADGYQWNYLISAVLDVAVIVCVLFRDRKNENKKTDEKPERYWK